MHIRSLVQHRVAGVGKARGRRRGIFLVLVVVILFLLLVLALAYFRLNQGMRRNVEISFLRLQLNTALNNSVVEAVVSFQHNANTPPPLDEEDKAVRLAAVKRRYEATDFNNAAYRRFMERNVRGFDYQGELLTPDEDDEQLPVWVKDGTMPDALAPEEWYERLREEPENFETSVGAPFSERLIEHTCSKILFSPVAISVLTCDPPYEREETFGEFSVAERITCGMVAFTVCCEISQGKVKFQRRLEKRYVFELIEPIDAVSDKSGEPLLEVQAPVSSVSLEQPAVAVLINPPKRERRWNLVRL